LSKLVVPAAVTLCSVGVLLVASPADATTGYIQKNSGGTDTATPIFEDTTNSNVGIGTTTPSSGYKLHVNGKILGKDMIAVYGTGAEQGLLVQTGSGSYHSLLRLKSPTSDYEILAEGATGSNSLRFYDYAAGAYRLTIDSSGNVGIGTTSPGAKLEVAGNLRLGTSNVGSIEDDGGTARITINDNGALMLRDDGGNLAMSIADSQTEFSGNSWVEFSGETYFHNGCAHFGSPSSGWLCMYESGYVITADGGIYAVGRIFTQNDTPQKPYTGTWTGYASDRRLKRNIQPLTGALDKFTKLQGVQYEWINPEGHRAPTEVGFIAQDLGEVFPHAIAENEPQGADIDLIPPGDKVKSYGLSDEFFAYLVEAVKELKSENDYLKQEVFDLKVVVCADHPQAATCNR
jgi:hypothetical protein